MSVFISKINDYTIRCNKKEATIFAGRIQQPERFTENELRCMGDFINKMKNGLKIECSTYGKSGISVEKSVKQREGAMS